MRYGTHITLALVLTMILIEFGIPWEHSKFLILGMLTLSVEYIGKTMFKLWRAPILHNLFTPSILSILVLLLYNKLDAVLYTVGWLLHLLLDLLKKKPKGVELFFPFSTKVFSLNIAEDYSKFDNTLLSILIMLTLALLLI